MCNDETLVKPKLKWFLILSLSFLIFLLTWLLSLGWIQKNVTDNIPAMLILSFVIGSSLSLIYFILAIKFPEKLWTIKYPDPVDPETGQYKCYKCGNETTMENLFKKVKKGSFVIKYHYYCPLCYEGYRKYSFFKSVLMIAFWGAIILLISDNFFLGWIFLNLAIAILLSHLSIIPHELGHAIVGKLVGMRIFRISVGLGNVLFKKSILGTIWELKAFPLFGYVIAFNKSTRWFRLKRSLMVAGGVFANIATLLIIYALAPDGFSVWDVTNSVSPLAVIIVLNWLAVLGSLWPYKFNSVIGETYSDGLNFFKTLFIKKAKIDDLISCYYSSMGMYWKEEGDYEKSKKWYEDGLLKFPDNYFCKNDLGVLCIKIGEFERAKELFYELHDENHDDKQIELLVKNNLAYVYSLIGDEDELDTADKLSAEVYENHSWNPTYKSTRGIVNIQNGRIDEGLEFLNEVLEIVPTPLDTVTNICHIAIGEFRRGNLDIAKEYYKMAKNIDSKCSILPLVEKELGTSVEG